MKITKAGIFFGEHYGITWRKGGSTNNGNGHNNFTISIFWKVGNGDDGARSLAEQFKDIK